MRLSATTIATTLLAAFALWPAGGWTTAQCAFKDQKDLGTFVCKKECLAVPKKDDVFGTDIYHEDSNVCRAALHAGYAHLEGGVVNFQRYQSNSTMNIYKGTVRNRITSVSGSKEGHLYRFAGTKPQSSAGAGGWTMLVHDSYNNNDILHVSCLGSSTTSFAYWNYIPVKRNVVENEVIKQLTKTRADNAHAFVCQGKEPAEDSQASITFRDAWYMSPAPSVTTSVGENLTIPLLKARSELPDKVFLRRLPDAWTYTKGASFADETLDLVFPSVTASQAGIYIVGNSRTDHPWSSKAQKETQMQGAYFQLIVRDCAHQRWGPTCSHWCPDCRNGGQCHPLTGSCICSPGFSGPDCSQACPQDFFGPKCDQECSPYFQGESPSPVEDNTCKGLTICLPYPYGCSCMAGYKGLHCDEACLDGHYGVGCTLTCSYCINEKCEANSGRCLDGCIDEVACDSNNFPLNLPHLTEPPQVRISTPSSASVSFDFGRRQRGLVTPPVKGYVVQYMVQNQDVWDSVSVSEEEFRKNKSLKVANLVPGSRYRLRVLVDTEKGIDSGRTHSRILTETFEMPCREYEHPNMTVEETTETTTIVQLSPSEWENFKKCNTVMEAWLDNTTKIAEGEAPSLEVTDLQGDTRYDIIIIVSNIKGESQSRVSFLTLPEAPDPVTGLALEADRNNFTVDFEPPQGNITDYVLEYYTMDTHLCPGESHPSVHFEEQPYMITQVDAFRAYNVCVAAVFKGAQGSKTCSTVITKPSPPLVAPKSMVCESNTTEITCRADLTDICGDLGGERIQMEMVTLGRSACSGRAWNVSTIMTRGDNWTFTGSVEELSPNVAYGVKARIVNEAGEGPLTANSQVLKTLPSVPEKPILSSVHTATSTSLLLLWNDPCPGMDEKLQYQIIFKNVRGTEENVTDIHKENVCQDSKYQHCYHLANLETGLTYTLQVVAINSMGRSLPSESKQGTTMESKSLAPSMTVERGATDLAVTLLRPKQTNGRLTKCRLQLFNGDKTYDIAPRFMSHVLGTYNVTGLKSGKKYDISAQCYNSAGWGMRMNMTFPTLPAEPEFRGGLFLLPHSVRKTSFVIRLPQVHRIGEGTSTMTILTLRMGEEEEHSGKTNFTSLYFELRSLHNGPRVRRDSPSPDTCPDLPNKRIVGRFDERSIPSEFTVGDGTTSGGYTNCKLITGQLYLVGVVVCTSLEGKLSCTEAQLNDYVLVDSSMTHTLAIVISVVLVVVIFSIFVGVFCTLRKRKSYSGMSTYKKEEDNVAVDLKE